MCGHVLLIFVMVHLYHWAQPLVSYISVAAIVFGDVDLSSSVVSVNDVGDSVDIFAVPYGSLGAREGSGAAVVASSEAGVCACWGCVSACTSAPVSVVARRLRLEVRFTPSAMLAVVRLASRIVRCISLALWS